MGARTTPDSPSSDKGATDPVNKTKEECKDEKKCWTDDAEGDISVNSRGTYFKKYKPDNSEHNYNIPVKYKIIAPAKTGSEITVEVHFKPEKQADVTDADVTSAKSKLEKGVKDHWDKTFTLTAKDPECPDKSFKVRYKVKWVDSGQHYTIKIHKTYAREGVTGSVMDVSKTTKAWTYAHEFAHCVGVPDEYSYTTDTEKVKYIKPDGTLDSAINAPPDGKSKTAADATIMSAVNNTKVLERHGWNIAIEVQKLLTAKLGRTIKCSISK